MTSPLPSTAKRPISFKLALALPVGRGEVYLGWSDEPDASPHTLTLYFDDGESRRFALKAGEAILLRTPKPRDPTGMGERTGGGFAIWIPVHNRKGRPLASLNDQAADAIKVPLLAPDRALAHTDLLEAYGFALAALANSQRDTKLAKLLEAPLAALAARRGNAFGAIEQAWRVAGYLLVIARITCEPQRVEKLEYRAGRGAARDISAQVRCFPLSTRQYANGKPAPGHITGLCLLVPLSDLPSGDATLHVSVAELGELRFPLRPLDTPLEALPDVLLARPQAIPLVLETLNKRLRGAGPRRLLAVLSQQCFDSLWQRADSKQQYGNACAAGVTESYALGEAGLAIFGVVLRPEEAQVRVFLHAEERMPIELTPHVVFLPVDGDLTPAQAHIPATTRNMSFFVHAPLPTAGGERRLLRITMPGVPDFWLKAETRPLQESGTALVRKLLGHLPHTDWLSRNFAAICDRGLGKLIEQAAAQTGTRSTPQVHDFGKPPRKPWVSVIVPLYGRYDFMRHQLAQFCTDPDFASGVELIYVVDDPNIETASLNFAARYQALFDVPLRVVTYAENRGFAGANNAGAAIARAPLLLLMNSDVLPQQPGWLSTLRRALEKLPRCGMVAPLLQYPEGAVQHAGMTPMRVAAHPGLVFNDHPGKGGAWTGGDKPSEQAMLTGACLLMKKQDYLAAGGLDESYVVGDFEDSDLSLKLRARGKRLYLAPAARLWHLERQSQYLGNNARSVRDLLTLYNAWRYRNKIAQGLLPDPEKLSLRA